jgi:predicted RNA-binding Zn-ribbon protein involved in translation (DUF1610 family)
MNEQKQIALLLKQLEGVSKLYRKEHSDESANFIDQTIALISEIEVKTKCPNCGSYANSDDFQSCYSDDDGDYEIDTPVCPDCIDDVGQETKQDEQDIIETYESLRDWSR